MSKLNIDAQVVENMSNDIGVNKEKVYEFINTLEKNSEILLHIKELFLKCNKEFLVGALATAVFTSSETPAETAEKMVKVYETYAK